MIHKDIFRLYDIRGTYPDLFNPETAERVANIFAGLVEDEYGKKPVIAVGRDARNSSPEIYENITAGLLKAGTKIIDLGVCPSPLTYFSLHKTEAFAYIMITGSHNPPEYNGLKLGTKDTIYHSEKIEHIYNLIISGKENIADKSGEITSFDVKDAYFKWTAEHFSDLEEKIKNFPRKIKVVIDSGNGTAATVAPVIFKNLGVEVIELFCEEDGNFPNHHPDPTVEENLEDAKKAIAEHNADFAAAFDGDSDRLGIVTENGTPIWGDQLLGIFAKDMQGKNGRLKVISDVKSSETLFRYLKSIDAEGIMWMSGHSMIKTKLIEEDADLAGEMAAHIYFKDRFFGHDDALYASLRFLETYINGILKKEIEKTSDFLALFEKSFSTPEMRLDCPDDIKFLLSDKIAEYFKSDEAKEKYGIKSVFDLDGIRVSMPDGWGLFRASNTQPVIVIRIEAFTSKSFENYKNIFLNIYKEMLSLHTSKE